VLCTVIVIDYRHGERYQDIPDPNADLKGFLDGVKAACDAQPLVYNPVTKAVGHCVDVRILKRIMTPVSCSIA
jgi:hypothetical protein